VTPLPPSKQGRPHTAESRAKISAANKGKTPWNKGLGHSEETKARIKERTKLVRVVCACWFRCEINGFESSASEPHPGLNDCLTDQPHQAMERKKLEKLAEMGLTLEEFEELRERQKEEERTRRREAKRNATMSGDYK